MSDWNSDQGVEFKHPIWCLAEGRVKRLSRWFGLVLDLVNGIWSGYPVCCIVEYSLDEFVFGGSGRSHAVWRGVIRLGNKFWIPCSACRNISLNVKYETGEFR